MFLSPAFLIGVVVILGGLILLLLSMRWFGEDEVASRLTEFVTEQPEKAKTWAPNLAFRTRNLTGSLLRRTFLPWVKGIGRVFGRLTPTTILKDLSKQLAIAGNPMGLEGREYFGISMVLILVGAGIGFLILRRGVNRNSLLMAAILVAIMFLLPRVWLQGKVRARKDSIRKGLPDALDMLSVCASAGLGFDQALQRVSEHWNTPIGAELGRVITEMEMGISRRDALRNLADRLEVSELTSFVSFIIQTDQLGMSITDTLHAQADHMRVERRFRAQEQAQKIPTKMLIPMAFLIFPALMAIILGPAVPSIVQAIQKMTQ